MAGTRALRLILRGRVQGVGFRWFVHQAAERCGVSGWVRNLPDGGVEVLAEGVADAVEGLVRAVKSGPRFSRVDTVEQEDVEPTGAAANGRFEIRI